MMLTAAASKRPQLRPGLASRVAWVGLAFEGPFIGHGIGGLGGLCLDRHGSDGNVARVIWGGMS